MTGFESNQRINQALLVLTRVLQPYVEREMRRVFKANWQQNLSVATGTDRGKPLDAYGLLKTMIDNWQGVFRDDLKPTIRNYVSLALAARNDVAHASGIISDTDAIAYLKAFQSVAEAIGAREAFITSASQTVMPVVRIDGRPVGNGAPGLVASALRADFHRHTEKS